MSDCRKEGEEKMAKAIFISNDCWLCVFDLLTPSKLGLGIALISHRFDFYVDEHFKTRKWALAFLQIRRKVAKNGTKEMEIFNCRQIPIPISEKPLQKKVIGFEVISIRFIDQNVLTFLRRFRQLFAVCPINLAIDTASDRILLFILRNIWPMIAKNICGLFLWTDTFHRLRQLVPSFLNDCPSLCVFSNDYNDFFAEFPCDDSAAASDGQAVAKWLFTALPNNVPKVFKYELDADDENLASNIEAIKAVFANASSPVNFIVVIQNPSSFAASVVPFDLINELTHEQLALKTDDDEYFLLVRCPIARDESKWAKWEEEAIGWQIDDQWNIIHIYMDDEREIGDGLLDETPGPSDQQQK
ncbi:hypothetical protein niasHT_038160 [Heterodera trifolii]|uniref:Uncharacterized protein n=1 Tax=Heterodera trifolii TaxID=157864 RepID=A0ABD2I9Q9_9BILA